MCDLVRVLASPQPKISRHLAYLRKAGLVKARKDGLWMHYSLSPAKTRFHRKVLECFPAALPTSRSLPGTPGGEPMAAGCGEVLRLILFFQIYSLMRMEQRPMDKLKVLFLCTGNSCRSQMAEGWARKLKGESIDAYSAGIEPHGMNARAVQVMTEAGVDISGQRSKHVNELASIPFNYVVTVCDHANETCPMFPGQVKRVHVGFEDPPKLAQSAKTEKEALDHYRRVRDEIRAFIERLPQALVDGQ